MDLGDLIQPDAVLPALKVNSKKQLLQIMSEKAAALTGLSEREVFDTVMQRERLARLALAMALPFRMERSIA